MNCKTKPFQVALLIWALLLTSAISRVSATPYASGITNTGGTVSFILNEAADNVKVIFDGGGAGNTNDLGARAKGIHSFTLGGHTAWQIHVTKSSAQVWTQISADTNKFNQFYSPRSVDVNRSPASPYFGRVYVFEHAGSTSPITTGSGRSVSKGIFALNADLSDALGQDDAGLLGGLDALTFFTALNNRFDPWKITVGDDNYLYVADAQDPRGGVARVDGNLSNGELVLAGVGNTTAPDVHTVVYGLQARGSLAGNNLKVWGIDGAWQNSTACNTVMRWDINGTVLPYAGAPTAIVQPGFPTVELETDLDVSPDGNIYVLMYRANVDAGGVKVYSPSGAEIWTSLVGGGDVFLNCVGLKVSPDGTKLAIARRDRQVWLVNLVDSPNGKIPDLSTTNIVSTFTGSSGSGRTVTWDAAGNLYAANPSDELLRVFSPGGTKTAITKSDGTFQLVIPPTIVSVTAIAPTADEQGPVNGSFTITRSGDTSGALTVNYTLSGTADNGTDYTALSGTVTFLPGASSTNLSLTINDDGTPELSESATITLGGSVNHGIGTGVATVSILDNETPEISFSTTATNRLLESYAPSKVTLQLARRGLLTPAVTANLAYSGQATRGADFNGPLTVDFASGAATASITLTSLNDQAYESNEIAVASAAAGSGYTAGPASGYVSVVDDEYSVGTLLFSDNFNTDTSTSWRANVADPADGFVEFAWDYGTLAGIPPAPATTDGTTKGLRMRCGNVFPQISGLSVSPLNGNFTGDYRLKFDLWINYNGPMPDGGPGSTQHFDAGVGTAGDTPVYYNNPSADGVWFTCSGDGADGATFGDYTAYIGSVAQNDDTGFYAAGTGAVNSGVRDHGHPFYTSLWGGQAAPAEQLTLYPGQTGVANFGNAGMAWHTVVITKAGDTVTWQMDGVIVATVTNDPVNLSTNVFVGYQDRFAVTLSDVPEMSFGLVDNLRVETYVNTPPVDGTPISITSIKIVGGNVEITFTGPPAALPSAFKLASAETLNGTYGDDNSATLESLGAGSFKATTALNGAARFFRIKY